MKKLIFLLPCFVFEIGFSQTSFVKKYFFQHSATPQIACEGTNDGVLVSWYTTFDTCGCGKNLLTFFDKNGDSVWTKLDYGRNEIHHAFDNGYYLSWYDQLSKIDSLGNSQWDFNVLLLRDNIQSVTQVSDSGYFLLGVKDTVNCCTPRNKHLYKLDKDGNMLWEKYYYGDYNFTSINATSDNGAIVSGQVTDTSGAVHQMFLKLDGNGDSLWIKTYPEFGSSGKLCVVFPNDDIAFITVRNNYALFVKTDSLGSILSIDSTTNNTLLSTITAGRDSSILTTGYLLSQANFNIGVLIRHFNPDYLNNIPIGENASDEFGKFIYQTSDYGYYIVAQRDTGILLLKNAPGHPFFYAINELSSESSFQLFPNPTTNPFSIKNLSSKKTLLLQIINPIGEIVYTEKLFGKSEYIIDANFTRGIYFVSVKDGERNVVRKLIIE